MVLVILPYKLMATGPRGGKVEDRFKTKVQALRAAKTLLSRGYKNVSVKKLK